MGCVCEPLGYVDWSLVRVQKNGRACELLQTLVFQPNFPHETFDGVNKRWFHPFGFSPTFLFLRHLVELLYYFFWSIRCDWPWWCSQGKFGLFEKRDYPGGELELANDSLKTFGFLRVKSREVIVFFVFDFWTFELFMAAYETTRELVLGLESALRCPIWFAIIHIFIWMHCRVCALTPIDLCWILSLSLLRDAVYTPCLHAFCKFVSGNHGNICYYHIFRGIYFSHGYFLFFCFCFCFFFSPRTWNKYALSQILYRASNPV